MASTSTAANAGGVTVFVHDKECQDMRQLRARLEDLRNKFQVCGVERTLPSSFGEVKYAVVKLVMC